MRTHLVWGSPPGRHGAIGPAPGGSPGARRMPRGRVFATALAGVALAWATGAQPAMGPSQVSAASPMVTPPPAPPIAAIAGRAQTALRVVQGGDGDVRLATVSGRKAWLTGSGRSLGSNAVPDYYLTLDASGTALPKKAYRAIVRVDYYDLGLDSFTLQYDGQSSPFTDGGRVAKTNTKTWRSANFLVCDPHFANRANGGDLRISDNADGAESISAVRMRFVAGHHAAVFDADAYGANPFDTKPDSQAIQALLDTSVCSGDTVRFTGGTKGTAGYNGYLVSRTIYLVGIGSKHNLTFASSSSTKQALFTATPDLKGYVLRSYARVRTSQPGLIDNITLDGLDIDGNRAARTCQGPDGHADGIADNWGSWLKAEERVSGPDDPALLPGNLGLDGGFDGSDPTQDYRHHPDEWSTGFTLRNVKSVNAECGSALSAGAARTTITDAYVADAGEHTHETGCVPIDADGDVDAWSDGMTVFGPDLTVEHSSIVNPSDVGIAAFGGRRITLKDIHITLTAGNHGAFAAIGFHGQWFGDVSGSEITGISVTSAADMSCGGFHAGIDVGPHMWGAGCFPPSYSQVAVQGPCVLSANLTDPNGALCKTATSCQEWIWASVDAPLRLHDNSVSGAHIDYVVGGVSGAFEEWNNVAGVPRLSDWNAARNGCLGQTWGPLLKVAHNPTLAGWTDLAVDCER